MQMFWIFVSIVVWLISMVVTTWLNYKWDKPLSREKLREIGELINQYENSIQKSDKPAQ